MRDHACVGGAEVRHRRGLPGGRCLTGTSVPLAGSLNQLYECVDDVWVVDDAVGTSGAAGPRGATDPAVVSSPYGQLTLVPLGAVVHAFTP